MLARFCFMAAAILFLLEGLHLLNRPMLPWGLFAVALGLAVNGWTITPFWKKT